MSSNALAYINPLMLKWTRKRSGYSIENAAKNLLNPKKLKKVEEGRDYLTFVQFKKIANRYKYPITYFYLKEPPKEREINDFRVLYYNEDHKSPHLNYEIRRIFKKRDYAVEYQKFGEKFGYIFVNSINIDQDTETVANGILKSLKINHKMRKKWKNDYDAFNGWKSAIEKLGVLIFQASNIKIEEMRGFSISAIPYPVIVLNRSDSPYGRCFSLIHELCHIMLDEGGLCISNQEDEDHFKIEKFCNYVAGAALVPKDDLLEYLEKNNLINLRSWEDSDLKPLVRFFKASKEVILRRLLIFGKISKSHYQEKHKYWALFTKKKSSGGEFGYQKVLRTQSKIYINLILNAYHNEEFTYSRLGDYLDMKLKNFDKLENDILDGK